MASRERYQKQSLGTLHTEIKKSRVLLVGAGGIGCELLKNLAKTGFGEIHIIDLDTIDLSNLNRQFLFRQEHIKKPKALVAKEAAQKFNPNVKLIAHHANIKDSQFNIAWFSQFQLVFNALDNLEARRHVNRMCLAADVPLIESGTTGFNGQVQVIRKGRTACYDCNPKTTPKSYPVCTIRSTPSQPIHCIVWGKSYLLPELFGVSEDAPEVDIAEDADNAEEIEKLKQEAEALKKIRNSMGSDTFAKEVFDKVFKEDIDRLRKMEDMWKTRKPPEPLSYEQLQAQSADISSTISKEDQRQWDLAETYVIFKDSLLRLSARLKGAHGKAAGGAVPLITFDKDDEDTLDFVTAAANLRAIIFDIEPKSKFDTKQMAGNIIPAIATTNAMIAGLCVLQSFKVLRGDYGRTKMIFLDRGNMSAGTFDPPNPDCVVCGNAMARLQVDSDRATLNDLVEGVLKLQLGYSQEISVLSEEGLVFDPDMEDNLAKKLNDLNIKDATFVTVRDETDEPRVDLQLAIEVTELEDHSKPVVLVQKDGEKLDIGMKPKQKEQNGDTDGQIVNGPAKRKRDAEEAGISVEANPAKKTTTNGEVAEDSGADGAAIMVDDEEGAITIDD